MTETTRAFAARLLAAHSGGPLIETVPPHLAPADLAGIYALQDEIIAQVGPVGGWKVLAGSKGEPTCSPIPASRYFADGDTIRSTHLRLVLAEVEIAVTLGSDLAANSGTSAVEAAIATIHPVIEMVGSPFVDRDSIDANVKLGDLQSNGAVIVGPALDPAIKADLAGLQVRLRLDDVVTRTADSGASWDAIVGAIRWLANHAAARGLPLKAGQVIITGARVVAPHSPAALIQGDAGRWGSVQARMTY